MDRDLARVGGRVPLGAEGFCIGCGCESRSIRLKELRQIIIQVFKRFPRDTDLPGAGAVLMLRCRSYRTPKDYDIPVSPDPELSDQYSAEVDSNRHADIGEGRK